MFVPTRFVRRPGRLAVLAGALAAAAAAACSDTLEGGAGCRLQLCPVTNEAVRDTVLEPVVLDTALSGVPVAGDVPALLLAVRPGPDSLDVRAVFRFDSLPNRYAPSAGGDSAAITTVRTTTLRLRVDTAASFFGAGRARVPAAPLTLEAYDVDTTAGADTLSAVLATLFRPDRRLGVLTLPAGAAVDTAVRIPIDPAAFAARVGGRLRVGVRIVSAQPAQLRVSSVRASGAFGPLAPALFFAPATDTATRELRVAAASTAPAGAAALGPAYVNQPVVIRSGSGPAGAAVVVGGLPARRTYLRFDVPPRFVDSVSLVRATLELTQIPAPGADALDTVLVQPLAVVATSVVTDLVRASELATPNALPSVRLSPAGSGVQEIAVIRLLEGWRVLPATTPRALVLASGAEGLQPAEVRFHSREAAPGLRPRLRLSYVNRTNFGLP